MIDDVKKTAISKCVSHRLKYDNKLDKKKKFGTVYNVISKGRKIKRKL